MKPAGQDPPYGTLGMCNRCSTMTPLAAAIIGMDIRDIPVNQARLIRLEVLRPGRPEREVIYPDDDSPLTVHLGVFDGSRLLGVATFLPDPCPGHDRGRAWRLRGMAVVASARDQGLGGQLLSHGLDRARRTGVDVVWCNGRVPARSFYERHGFAAVGEQFDIPVTGPHYLFVHRVAGNSSGSAPPPGSD